MGITLIVLMDSRPQCRGKCQMHCTGIYMYAFCEVYEVHAERHNYMACRHAQLICWSYTSAICK